MNETTYQQALTIMNEEINNLQNTVDKLENIPTEVQYLMINNIHQLHNWLCTQEEDTELMQAIVKWKGQASMLNGFNYISKQYENVAQKCRNIIVPGIIQTTNGIGMVATDNDVYQSIREYYVNYDPDKMNPQPKQNKPIKKKTRTKTEPKGKFTELDKEQTQNSAEVEELTLF
ncbi:hypothetical protein QUW35_00060 [Ligilactobacillus agilis]|uniref:Cas9 inhibitor AcrIIA9 family protein n=1 Tax=Ligilactobacillus agilis TaxID=1601 RepID=UPI0025A4A4B2|nr:Cas9 inhibitor AcrIIA9 family protein [Ligilactobacillus agilis]MDM8279088.1 hypothetical protein [Ligilactobacillus agilis]